MLTVIDPSAPLGAPLPPPGSQPPQVPPPPNQIPPPGYVPPPPNNAPPPGYYPPPPQGYPPPPGTGYPPPPPPPDARPRRPRSDPGGLVAGLVIAGIGLFFLAGELEPDIGRFVTLIIGLALLAVFVVRREYGFLVPGSILTGVGIGIALQPAVTGDEASGGVMMLALAGGFLGIWVLGAIYRLPQNHWWPLIPGGILTLIGLVQLSSSDINGAIRLWPIILIIAGALVLGRTINRRT